MSTYAGDLTPADAWALLESTPQAVLVDVRTVGEWENIGIPDTAATGREPVFVEWQQAPSGQVNPAFLDELEAAGIEPGAPIVFLCRSGVRSIAAAQAATAAGLGPAYNILEGFEGGLNELGERGWQGWVAAGLPWGRHT